VQQSLVIFTLFLCGCFQKELQLPIEVRRAMTEKSIFSVEIEDLNDPALTIAVRAIEHEMMRRSYIQNITTLSEIKFVLSSPPKIKVLVDEKESVLDISNERDFAQNIWKWLEHLKPSKAPKSAPLR
jgi:ABC-type iron transport system FetAB ATPase subunit